MATSLGRVYLNGCNYELAYDLLGQNVEGNYSNVRLYGILHVTNNYISWTRGSASVHTSGLQGIGTYYSRGDYTVITRDFTFGHDNNGNFSTWIGASLSTTFVSGDTGGTLTLPSIPRFAKITSAPNFNDEENPTINYSNPAGTYVSSLQACISLTGAIDDIAYRDISKTGNSYTFNLTESERNVLRNATTTGNSRKVLFFVRTTIGGSTSHSILERTLTIINANPTFSNFEFEDTNTTTLALTGNNQYNVNGYSNIKATISTTNKATAKKSATMSKYRFAIGSNSVDINYSSSQKVSGTINKATNGTYNVYAIDSRNNSTLVTKLASKVIPYENIYINPNESIIERNDNRVGDNAILTLKGTFWNDSFGSVTNTIKSVTYRLRKTDSSTWINGETTITPTISGNNFTFTGEIASDNQDTSWDLDSSYYIEVTITDELSTSIKGFTLNSAIPTMSLDKNGVGIMCAYDSNLGGSLQVGGKAIKSFESFTLYENSSGNNGTIIFDENPYDYSYIEIYGYEGVFDTSFYTKYDMSLNKTISLYKLSTNSSQNRLQVSNYGIRLNSNNKYEMYPINSYMNVILGTTVNHQTNNQEFYITKILAYK